MDLHDFADKLVNDLSDQIDGLISMLIKADANRHDRVAGHILGLSQARALITETRKKWAMRDGAQEGL